MPKEEDFKAELRRALVSQEPTRLDAVRDLLRQKANPNLQGAAKELSPLRLGLKHGDPELCRLLLLHQADPAPALNDARQTSEPAELEPAEVILKWALASCRAADDDDASVLQVMEDAAADAAKCHDFHSLGLALASLEVAGGDGEACAARPGRRLLDLCASNAGLASLRGDRGQAAARATTRVLIGWGAELQPSEGETPLQLALRSARAADAIPRSEPARTLLEEGADVEQPHPETGETLLMEAAREGDFVACELLLEFRADPLRRRRDDKTAITLASRDDVPRQVLLTLRSALTRALVEESFECEDQLPAVAGPAAAKRRSASGAFSKMAATESTADTAETVTRRRSTPGAFSKQSAEDRTTTPISDQAKSLSFGESESETRLDETDEAPSRAPCFSMSEVDQEMFNSAEGLLNQVDLEEAYDDDWTVHNFPPRFSPPSSDAGERMDMRSEVHGAADGYPMESNWPEQKGQMLQVVG
ncbi:unnamed protein product [Effrenium voratum]|nr:unnamed protein product [Effrenium voratum]